MIIKYLSGTALALGMVLICNSGLAEEDDGDLGDVLFRYKSDNGSLMVNQSIPPDAAAKGYEIITDTGRVLKTVPPAPKGEDAVKYAEKLRREAALAEWDAQLRRRFSSVKDIQSAKKRALSELQGNVSLLQSNLSGIVAQLEDQQRRAGIMERNGNEVSDTVLKNINSLDAEAHELRRQIKARSQELDEKAAKYDRDIERFKEINS
ncbi:hypothetical protein [Gilvimarinus sp. DA14]|uniref:hypothetical protein n=1 Tax=Gilvimarinus sp. DA14 TaxID=2956798 RepID=UPI0020B84BCE|nr:hypothetical protein [Gilvimarinus sp. DA14]UTF59226.1 hypothetical protein NHM04_12145 [Gilvimarinus sp. DA14]